MNDIYLDFWAGLLLLKVLYEHIKSSSEKILEYFALSCKIYEQCIYHTASCFYTGTSKIGNYFQTIVDFHSKNINITKFSTKS